MKPSFAQTKPKPLFQFLRFSLWSNNDLAGNCLIVQSLIKHNTCKHVREGETRNYLKLLGDVPESISLRH